MAYLTQTAYRPANHVGLLSGICLAHAGLLWLALSSVMADRALPLPVAKPMVMAMLIPQAAPPAPLVPQPKPQVQPKAVPQAKTQSAPKAAASPPLLASEHAAATAMSAPTQPAEPAATPAAVAAPAPAAAAPQPIVAPQFSANYLNNPAPVYPNGARRMGEEGRVLLRVHVTVDGQADEVQLHRSSGSPTLDEAASAAVRNWRFVPARQGETAVAAWVIVPIDFRLR